MSLVLSRKPRRRTKPKMVNYDHTVTTLTRVSTPDPYMTQAFGKYYLTFTSGGHIAIWCSDSMIGFRDRATKHIIWQVYPQHGSRPQRPEPNTPHSADIWAPELHSVYGRWYVYFAATHPVKGNPSHRIFVLGGPPANSDPCGSSPKWEFLGRLRGLPDDQWAIDGTVMTLNQQLYFVYSGWPWNAEKGHWVWFNDKIQALFIVRLLNPVTVDTAAGPPVMISRPDQVWEFSGASGVNEGPQALQSPDGKWEGIAYSCAGSWTHEYKMNTLRFLGGDPLDARQWQKSTKPLVTGAHGRAPYGPGHGNFVHVGNEVVGVFHATDKPGDGWANRKARAQTVIWKRGEPYMGETVGKLKDDGKGRGAGRSTSGNGLKGLLLRIKDEL